MTDEERQELRDWAAGLTGWKVEPNRATELTIITQTFNRVPHYFDSEDKIVMQVEHWRPDALDAPASQIMLVIEAMRERGWRLHLNYPGFMNPNQVSAGFSRLDGAVWPRRYFKADTLPLAILKAARAALEGE